MLASNLISMYYEHDSSLSDMMKCDQLMPESWFKIEESSEF